MSAVFHNRLRLGMMLQSDPTTIYGVGETFDGNLRRNHLRTDTPYNTYVRTGLTPTPISMPGKVSLQAAARPAPVEGTLLRLARRRQQRVLRRPRQSQPRSSRYQRKVP